MYRASANGAPPDGAPRDPEARAAWRPGTRRSHDRTADDAALLERAGPPVRVPAARIRRAAGDAGPRAAARRARGRGPPRTAAAPAGVEPAGPPPPSGRRTAADARGRRPLPNGRRRPPRCRDRARRRLPCGAALLPGGFTGVDVFFVISGFVITGLLVRELERRGRIDLPNFYARRVRRLLPAAVLALGTTLLLSALDHPAARAAARRGRWGGVGAVRREYPLRARAGRLLRGGVIALAVPPLLVAERRGAVLPRVARDAAARVPLRAPAERHRSGHPRDRDRLARAPRSGSPTSPRAGPSTRSRRAPGSSPRRPARDRRAAPLPLTAVETALALVAWLGLGAVVLGSVLSTNRSPIRAPGRSSRRSERRRSSRAATAPSARASSCGPRRCGS